MIIQGSNNPLVIQFDTDVDTMPVLVVTLWSEGSGCQAKLLKQWNVGDMDIIGDTAICPITERLTKSLPKGDLVIEAKGLDDQGNTIFWDQYKTDVLLRRDRVITLIQAE